jgi:hypothetical protein
MHPWQRVYHSLVMTPAKLVVLPVPAPLSWGQTLVHLCQGVALHTSDMLLRQQGTYSHSGYTLSLLFLTFARLDSWQCIIVFQLDDKTTTYKLTHNDMIQYA